MTVRLRRLWMQFTADPKKVGMLCVMVVAGLLLWARLIIVSNMPRTAVAGPEKPESGKSSESATPSAPSHNERAPVSIDLAASPDRDPFVISPAYFPKPT